MRHSILREHVRWDRENARTGDRPIQSRPTELHAMLKRGLAAEDEAEETIMKAAKPSFASARRSGRWMRGEGWSQGGENGGTKNRERERERE